MNPQFPIYIPSKGRADSRLTMKALTHMGIPFFVVVEEQEHDLYAAVLDPATATILILDPEYQRTYETCDLLGDSKSKGPGPARNFIWDHSIAAGASWHWVMDDNIRGFYRYNRNRKVSVDTGAIFVCMEDFCLRYTNVAMAGPYYDFLVPTIIKQYPLILNTRVYSCNLIRNDVPYRWRGRYNEDTDLSLRMLKDGWCTIQFRAFLQKKMATQKVKGGNTGAFYAAEGTWAKSRMQYVLHPDVTRMVRRYDRWHHCVDYRPFKSNRLMRREDVTVEDAVNEFGMILRRIRDSDGDRGERCTGCG